MSVRRTGTPVKDYLLQLTDADPLAGAFIEVPRVMRCATSGLRHLVGFVSDDTMRAVERAIRELLELP